MSCRVDDQIGFDGCLFVYTPATAVAISSAEGELVSIQETVRLILFASQVQVTALMAVTFAYYSEICQLSSVLRWPTPSRLAS